ncbi:TonB-dependent siderophore receptor [Anabaena catenula]|uniref:TonB-dependent siderophore receptor n=1 Tax=Anabaena catenula FACHB-362 TaxID=2692877 RepID=A0ABR8IYU5_9NOST|nr:TonB-dependent siderophore receptor [Anabaena catenula FACHB-362]
MKVSAGCGSAQRQNLGKTLFTGVREGATVMKFELMNEIRSAGLALAFIGSLVQPAYAEKQTKEISSVEDKEHYSTSAAQLLAQTRNTLITKITGIKVNTTDKGIEVILESPNIEALKPVNKSQGNNFIVEIPNTVLSLGKQNSFNQKNPVAGISNISVTQTNANTVQLTVTGEKGLPTAELFDGDKGLIFELAPVASATNPPQQSQTLVKISEVKFNTTTNGLEIILATPEGDKLQVSSKKDGNTFIIDIPSAQLNLPNGDTVSQKQPTAGISDITVSNFNTNTIRVTVTGTDSTPTVELFDSEDGLIFGVTSTASTSQPETQPTPTPQSENLTQPEQPTAQSDEPIELVVTGEQDSYRIPNASAGTRTDTAIRDIPQAIQVIPKQVLQEQQVQRLSEALKNTAGVITTSSERNVFDLFNIRGFSNRNIIRNGLRDDTNATAGSGIANIEQIEVLRGPASVLFGQGGAGGTVNIVTKKPLQIPFYRIEGTIGSYDLFGGSVDFTGPLNDSKTLLYRLNASALSSDTFVDFVDIERYFIAPVLTWQIGQNTQLTLEADYFDTQQRNDRGLPAVGTVLPNPNGKIPRNRFVNEPSVDKNNRQVLRVGYNLEHRFSPDWRIQNSFRSSFQRSQQNSGFLTSLSADGRTVQRSTINTDDSIREIFLLDTNVVGNVKTGNIEHKLLLGFDLSRDVSQGTSRQFQLTPLDLFNPEYGSQSITNLIATSPNEPSTSEALGFYLQDQIALSDNLKIILGGRFDIVNQKLENSEGTVTSFQEDTAFSPRIGIVYQPTQLVSLYANYSRSFQQVTGTTFDSGLFKPERGTQYEIGAKFDWTNKLSSTVSLYQITRSNVLTPDPINPNFSIQTGEQRSRGFELDIVGEILPGWKIIGGYAYTDAQVTQANNITEGNRINNVPEHAFSLWNTYEIQQGNLQGLGLGLGLFYVGEREGDLNNTFSLPGYLRTDAALFYRRNNFRAAINLQNLFDTEYFELAENRLRVFYGAPRTVKLTLGWEF